MRQILFKGRRVDNGALIMGWYVEKLNFDTKKDESWIINRGSLLLHSPRHDNNFILTQPRGQGTSVWDFEGRKNNEQEYDKRKIGGSPFKAFKKRTQVKDCRK